MRGKIKQSKNIENKTDVVYKNIRVSTVVLGLVTVNLQSRVQFLSWPNVWSFVFFLCLGGVFSGYFNFLTRSKDMQIRSIGYSKLPHRCYCECEWLFGWVLAWCPVQSVFSTLCSESHGIGSISPQTIMHKRYRKWVTGWQKPTHWY